MGCDIHVMVEARNFPIGTDEWSNVDNWRYEPQRLAAENYQPQLFVKSIYNWRSYELFSFLAGVRNYGMNPSFGFDRGFPEDADSVTKNEFDAWGGDAHTPGYATLAELKEKISTVSKVKRKGYVHKEEIAQFRETGETPSHWCQGVGGQAESEYEWLEWEDEVHCFDMLLAAIEERKRDVFWIFDPDKDDGSHDGDIRIVFWFDN